MQTQLQTNSHTFLGRYWNELAVLRRYFPSDYGISILSFGSSTGEELATARLLFPNARLFGCDIDWHDMRIARAQLGDSACIFESSPAEIERHGPFDIIFCNSVLLRTTARGPGAGKGIDPRLWSDTVSMLDASMAAGGVFQIINSNIPFRLHPASAKYETLASPMVLGPHFVDQFDLDGRHLCSGIPGSGFSAVLNRHLGEEGWRTLLPGDLRHVHFRKEGGFRAPVVEDELIPNTSDGLPLASGMCVYRSEAPQDRRPCSYLEVGVEWETAGAVFVRTRRHAKRIWFDGTIAEEFSSKADLAGPDAIAFFEAMTGRRSTGLALNAMLNPVARRTF